LAAFRCNPTSFIILCCQTWQLLPFKCLIDGILPGDRQLNVEETVTRAGPQNQIWTQVGVCDFRWESELFGGLDGFPVE